MKEKDRYLNFQSRNQSSPLPENGHSDRTQKKVCTTRVQWPRLVERRNIMNIYNKNMQQNTTVLKRGWVRGSSTNPGGDCTMTLEVPGGNLYGGSIQTHCVETQTALCCGWDLQNVHLDAGMTITHDKHPWRFATFF